MKQSVRCSDCVYAATFLSDQRSIQRPYITLRISAHAPPSERWYGHTCTRSGSLKGAIPVEGEIPYQIGDPRGKNPRSLILNSAFLACGLSTAVSRLRSRSGSALRPHCGPIQYRSPPKGAVRHDSESTLWIHSVPCPAERRGSRGSESPLDFHSVPLPCFASCVLHSTFVFPATNYQLPTRAQRASFCVLHSTFVSPPLITVHVADSLSMLQVLYPQFRFVAKFLSTFRGTV